MLINGFIIACIIVCLFWQYQANADESWAGRFFAKADCHAHSSVSFPSQIKLALTFFTNNTGETAVNGSLSVSSEQLYHETIIGNFLNQEAWVMFVVPGPSLSGEFFCQNLDENKVSEVTIHQGQHTRLRVNQAAKAKKTEPPALKSEKTLLTLRKDPTSATYRAGAETTSPYWLEIYYHFYQPHSQDGSQLQYKF